jgi:hypothetical protein
MSNTTYTKETHPLRWLGWWIPLALIGGCLVAGFAGNLLNAYADIWHAAAGNPYSRDGVTNPAMLALSKQANGLGFLLQWFSFMFGAFGSMALVAKVGMLVHLKMGGKWD